MNDHMHDHQDVNEHKPWWRTRSGIVLVLFLAVAGFFLFTEHRAHVLGVLPYLILAACPLMHLFHHGGHHHGHGRHSAESKKSLGDKSSGERP